MISFRRPATSFVLALSLGAVVLGQQPAAPALDIRMGLWEVTNTIDFGGGIPGVDMSKMTPEQQARMGAAMRGMQPKPTTTKSCMTREAFDRQNFTIA